MWQSFHTQRYPQMPHKKSHWSYSFCYSFFTLLLNFLRLPYMCEFCSRGFKSRGQLSYHLKTHSENKPYKCCFCHKAFRSRGNLQMHIRTHTGEEAYKCNLCDKAFARRSYLADHTNTHTGQKPYNCSLCCKAFTSGKNLKEHSRMHVDGTPFKCRLCDIVFDERELNWNCIWEATLENWKISVNCAAKDFKGWESSGATSEYTPKRRHSHVKSAAKRLKVVVLSIFT